MQRFTLIDGLRGIAALMVVIGHLYQTVESTYNHHLPPVINSLLESGHWGVEIFFVISGFVIVYSVRHGTWTLKYLAKFGLRRSIRLDPPYWAVIALEIALLHISLSLFPELDTQLPTFKQIAAHLVYLQGLLGLGQLVPIFWTLCYEVQFYLVLVGGLVLFTYLNRAAGNNRWFAVIVFTILAAGMYIYSLGTFLQVFPSSPQGLFIDRWYQFFLGVLAWWSSNNKSVRWLFAATWILSASSLIIFPVGDIYRYESTIVILATSLLVYIGSISGNLTRWLNNRVVLFLGSISYGLYLIHLSVGWRLIALEKKLLGEDPGLFTASLMVLSGIALSIFAAWLLHVTLEKPAMDFSHKVRLPKRETRDNTLAHGSALQPARTANS